MNDELIAKRMGAQRTGAGARLTSREPGTDNRTVKRGQIGGGEVL
ncbi:MAG TPA: hypothetical protein VE243_05725 [Candidatus Acidoferrum sp.]|nr:hypothetical protein [Candidatus Acidoferrum sp.]